MNRKDTALLINEWKQFNREEELIFKSNLMLEEVVVKSTKNSFLSKMTDWLQTGFDIMGFIPGLGEGFDAINAIISLSRDQPFEALCSIISLFPGVGDIVGKGGKYLIKYLGPVMELILTGKIKDPRELKQKYDKQEAEKSDAKMFKIVVKAISGTKNRWFPFIKDFLESLEKNIDSVELVDKIEKSEIKVSKIPDASKILIGNKIKDMIKDPRDVLDKITNLVNFIDKCAKE